MATFNTYYQNEGMEFGRKKKRRNQNRISFLITLLWEAHSGGERESAEKKQGEETFVRFYRCSGRIFFGSDPITRHTGVKAAEAYHRALLI